MAKTKYTPFLKLKVNEVAALASLEDEVSDEIVPFLDLPTNPEQSAATFSKMVVKSARKMEINWGKNRPFFLDNYDIPDAITIGGKANYSYVAEAFSTLNFIPVLGLNRSPAHNQAVIQDKTTGLIQSTRFAIRLVEDDFEDFSLVENDLEDLLKQALAVFDESVLIMDCRVCLNSDPAAVAKRIFAFLTAATAKFKFVDTIVTGSSLPAQIGLVAKTAQDSEVHRVELQIFKALRSFGGMGHVGLGDYTVVSPHYSDVTLPKEMLPNITAPKILYAYGPVHFIARGNALKSHVRGNLQYNDMLAELTKMSFFRGKNYSVGDAFLATKAVVLGGKMVTPGSILNPTINAHITYMTKDHPLVA